MENKISQELEKVENQIKLNEDKKRLLACFEDYQGEDQVVCFKELHQELLDTPFPEGCKTGIPDLDKKTEGFREGNVVIVSGTTGSGKTAILQTFTREFSKREYPTLFFTYEVPPKEFLRKFEDDMPEFAYLPKQHKGSKLDWLEERIIEGIAKYKTKIVMIDHLHFLLDMKMMSGNTSLFIGGIMRELKRIAIEYQLIIFLVAHTKKTRFSENEMPDLTSLRDCLPSNQLVYSGGKRILVKDIKIGMSVVSLGAFQKLQNDIVKDIWTTGKKEIYRLETKTGRIIECSNGHKFYALSYKKGSGFKYGENKSGTGIQGWTELKNLKIGQKIAIIKNYPEIKNKTISKNRACLLGWIIGDGHIRPQGYTEITTETIKEAEFIKKIADKEFNLDCKIKKYKDKNAFRIYLSGNKNSLAKWLRELNFCPIGKNKYVPEIIFQQSKEIIGAFLSGLFQADGTIRNNKGSYEIISPSIKLFTISNQLAYDVQHLLIRLGIISYVKSYNTKNSGFRSKNSIGWEVIFTGSNIVKFGKFSGFLLHKKNRFNKLTKNWKPKDKERKNDIFFDKIKSIKFIGEKETYDIQAEGKHSSIKNHSLCVNDILTHNSG